MNTHYKFDPKSNNCVVIMYPTGGYGNFLYYILTEFLKDTVKTNNNNFKFSNSGDSHSCKKYVEPFLLGSCYANQKLKEFQYCYAINDQFTYNQISSGKKFLVLADVGNLGDNVNFLRKYFPNATIFRIYAESFEEKLIVWANCMTKSDITSRTKIYKDSLLPSSSIANFNKKSIKDIEDEDAVLAIKDFMLNDFYRYGKNFSKIIKKDKVVNIPFNIFLEQSIFLKQIKYLAKYLQTEIIDLDKLKTTYNTFKNKQKNHNIRQSNNSTIIGKALCNLKL